MIIWELVLVAEMNGTTERERKEKTETKTELDGLYKEIMEA
jgi:hypothetical protein